MHGADAEVTGVTCLDGCICRFIIPDFTDTDDVRVPPIASLRASKYDVAAVELKENKTADAMRVRVICFFIIISVSCIEVFWV
ncbi:hypothetical protein C0P19_004332 [Escherichia coli]|nr:hypothetical protein [Escherichia coli]